MGILGGIVPILKIISVLKKQKNQLKNLVGFMAFLHPHFPFAKILINTSLTIHKRKKN